MKLHWRVLLFVLLLPALQILTWAFQEYALKIRSDIVTGSLLVLFVLFSFITCLLYLRRDGYLLTFLSSFLICVIISFPSLFIYSFFVSLIHSRELSSPALPLRMWLTYYGLMEGMAVIVAFFFRSIKTPLHSGDITKRIIYVIFFTLLLAGGMGYVGRKLNYRTDTRLYGKAYNKERMRLGVPIVEDKWFFHQPQANGSGTWMNRWAKIQTKKPHHYNKASFIKDKKLISETDAFNTYVNDSVAHRVFYNYNFDSATWKCEFLIYTPYNMQTITLAQADSIIGSWGLRRN